jgi:hypothetical protein
MSLSPLAIPEVMIFRGVSTIGPPHVVVRATRLRQMVQTLLQQEHDLHAKQAEDVLKHASSLLAHGDTECISPVPLPREPCPSCASLVSPSRESYHSSCVTCGLVLKTHAIQDKMETPRLAESGHSGFTVDASEKPKGYNEIRQHMDRLQISPQIQTRVLASCWRVETRDVWMKAAAALVAEMLKEWAAEYCVTPYGIQLYVMGYENRQVARRPYL